MDDTTNRGRILLAAALAAASAGGCTSSLATSADPGAEMIARLRAAGPHASVASEAALFDRFIGTWDFDCVLTDADGKVTRFTGEWSFGWVLDGRALQDVWIRHPDGGRPERGMGTSIRFFDRASQQWRVVWIAPHSGNVLTLHGGRVADRIVLEGDDVDGSPLRWSFDDVREDAFLWRGEISADHGTTWRVEQEMWLRRRGHSPRR